MRQGFLPDVISTDLHTSSMNDGMKDMTNVMSKFLRIALAAGLALSFTNVFAQDAEQTPTVEYTLVGQIGSQGFEWVGVGGEIDGVRYSHIVDPRTGLGLTHRVAATVRAPSGALADALASAACVVGGTRRLIDDLEGMKTEALGGVASPK